jgi:putative ABC transport system permease protein
MNTLLQDIRYALRILRKSPAFTAIAILTLALGIGANTAIFSVIQNVLLRPLPYENPGQLIEIWCTYPPAVPIGGLSPGDFHDWQKEASTVSVMSSYGWAARWGANLTGDGAPERIRLNYATSNLFPMLGKTPAAGHFFSAADDNPGAPPVVILTHRFWQSRFGADPNIIGHSITLDGLQYTIRGVLPANSGVLDSVDLWMPMGRYPDDLNDHTYHELSGLARLKPGITLAQARAEFESLNHQEALAYPAQHKGFGILVRQMQDPDAAQMRQSLLTLFAAVGLVLLIACANVISLLLARNAARSREIALRVAIGANQMRLVRQLLTESTLLALLGGGVGIAFGIFGVKAVAALAPANLSSIRASHLNAGVFLFALALCAIVGVVCGLLPALQIRKVNVNAALKEGGKGTSALASHKLHNLLVVSEIALALIPLCGAGLLLRSLQRLLNVSPGFQPDDVLSIEIPQAAIPQAELAKMSPDRQKQLTQKQYLEFQQILERVQALPGVKSAAGIDVLPLASEIQQASRFVIEGRPIPNAGVRPIAEMRTVTPGYFSTMDIPLLSGRVVTATDYALNLDINEAMARRFWPRGDAIGKRINLCSLAPQPCWWSIVGIVGDVHQFALDAAPTFDVYFSGSWTPYLMIRTALDPHRIAAAAAGAIHKIDPALPVGNVMSMDELLSGTLAPRRFSALLISIFAGIALLLASIGVYGVMSYVVGKRTSEIGIRMALGASPLDVLRWVMTGGMRLALLGVAIGIAGSLALTTIMATQLFGVSAHDPLTFAVVAATLLLIALAAIYIPARRAMCVDPMVALRYE